MVTPMARIRELVRWLGNSCCCPSSSSSGGTGQMGPPATIRRTLASLPCRRRNLEELQASAGLVSHVTVQVLEVRHQGQPSSSSSQRRPQQQERVFATVTDDSGAVMALVDHSGRLLSVLSEAADADDAADDADHRGGNTNRRQRLLLTHVMTTRKQNWLTGGRLAASATSPADGEVVLVSTRETVGLIVAVDTTTTPPAPGSGCDDDDGDGSTQVTVVRLPHAHNDSPTPTTTSTGAAAGGSCSKGTKLLSCANEISPVVVVVVSSLADLRVNGRSVRDGTSLEFLACYRETVLQRGGGAGKDNGNSCCYGSGVRILLDDDGSSSSSSSSIASVVGARNDGHDDHQQDDDDAVIGIRVTSDVVRSLCGDLDSNELAHDDGLARHSMRFLRALIKDRIPLHWTIRINSRGCGGPPVVTGVALRCFSLQNSSEPRKGSEPGT